MIPYAESGMCRLIHLTCFLLLGMACSASGSETVTNAHELLSIQKKLQNGIPFELTGQIVIPPSITNLPFVIEVDNRCIKLFSRLETSDRHCAVGDTVRACGVTAPSQRTLSTNLDCTGLRVLSHGTLAEVPVIGIAEFLAGDYANRRISVRGTLTDVLPDGVDARFFHMTLTDRGKTAYLIWQNMSPDLKTLLRQRGAEVVATGVGAQDFGSRSFADSLPLSISGTNAIRIVKAVSHDPFDAPEIAPCDRYRQVAARLGKMNKLRGTVIARWNGDSFLLRLSNGKSARVELSGERLPRLHKTVEAVGHLETDLIDLYLLRASWRETVAYDATIPPPVKATLHELFTNNSGSEMIEPNCQGKTFQIRGTVKNISADTKGHRSILLADGKHSILINCSDAGDALNAVAEGCVIEVTGVCVKDSDIWHPNVDLPKVRGIFLVPNSPGDVRILATPPWWTPARFALAVVLLLAVLVAVLIWNASLQAMVTRKSRALLREQAEKLGETLKIDERTRLAAELHDYLAQNLTVISYQVSAAISALAANSADAADCLKTADRMLLSCRTDLRRCLWDLKSDALNEPDFAKAIARTSEPVAGDARLFVRFAVNRNRLSDSTAHAILSICRELVSNAVRHGKADKVQIAGELKDDVVRFSVRDNGLGFDPAKRPRQTDGHFGLDGVAERIRRLNGQLQIDSSPGKGTRIVVTLRPKDSPT